MRTLTRVGLIILLSGCAMPAKRGGESVMSGLGAVEEGSLFIRWEQDHSTFVMNFSGGSCSAPFAFNYLPPGGAVCKCTMNCVGSSSSGGNARFSGCRYVKGSATPDMDPGCATLNARYTYSNDGASLSFTNVATQITTTYHPGSGGSREK